LELQSLYWYAAIEIGFESEAVLAQAHPDAAKLDTFTVRDEGDVAQVPPHDLQELMPLGGKPELRVMAQRLDR
jgi:hypothetical protein